MENRKEVTEEWVGKWGRQDMGREVGSLGIL